MFALDVDGNLKLKLLLKQNSEELFSLININRLYLETFMPRIKENKSIEYTEKVIELFLDQLKENNGFRAGIYYDDKLVGIIGLKCIDWINKKTEIMYWVDKSHTGKGIATKCTQKVVELAFDYYDLNKVVLKSSVENEGSINIAKKCGFKLEGTLKEDELLGDNFTNINIYSILKKVYKECD